MDILQYLESKRAALIIAQNDAKNNPDDLADDEYFGSDEFYDTSILLLNEIIKEIKGSK